MASGSGGVDGDFLAHPSAQPPKSVILDAACKRSGLPLIRFKTARRYRRNVIRETVKAHVPNGAVEVRPSDSPETDASGRRRALDWLWKRVR